MEEKIMKRELPKLYEPGEVEDITWIPIDRLDRFEWTRGQIEVIHLAAAKVGWHYNKKLNEWFKNK